MSLLLAVILAAAAAGVFLVGGGAWLFARLWAKPHRVIARRSASEIGLDAQTVSFASGGKQLNGWFVPASAAGGAAPTVVLVHGWSSESSQMLPLAKPLHQAGFAVLAFDARGHGRSPADGPITLRKFTEDILAAMAYAAGRHDVDGSRLAIVGHSFGGSSALLAAAWDQRASAVASLSAFSDPVEVTRQTLQAMHLPRGAFLWLVLRVLMHWMKLPPEAVTPRVQVGRIRVPILLAHGSLDRRVSPSELDRLAVAASGAEVTPLLVDGSGHRSLLKSPELGGRLIGFLESALAEPGAQTSALTEAA